MKDIVKAVPLEGFTLMGTYLENRYSSTFMENECL